MILAVFWRHGIPLRLDHDPAVGGDAASHQDHGCGIVFKKVVNNPQGPAQARQYKAF